MNDYTRTEYGSTFNRGNHINHSRPLWPKFNALEIVQVIRHVFLFNCPSFPITYDNFQPPTAIQPQMERETGTILPNLG